MINIDKTRLIEQLKQDEGFRAKAYPDIKQYSIGFGTRAKNKDEVIDKVEASKRLAAHVEDAIDAFDRIFEGHQQKFNDIRAEAFINMIYNMGPGRKGHPEIGGLLSFQNTLGHIFDFDEVNWSRVAYNLTQSKWYKQVGDRAKRICKEIESGNK